MRCKTEAAFLLEAGVARPHACFVATFLKLLFKRRAHGHAEEPNANDDGETGGEHVVFGDPIVGHAPASEYSTVIRSVPSPKGTTIAEYKLHCLTRICRTIRRVPIAPKQKYPPVVILDHITAGRCRFWSPTTVSSQCNRRKEFYNIYAYTSDPGKLPPPLPRT